VIKDWNFSDANSSCSFRTAGVLIRNNKLLLQSFKGDYALPGGRVNFGETAKAGVIREFKEELNVDIAFQRLIWVEEHFWKWDNKDMHSLCFYSLVSLKNNSALPDDFTGAALDNKEVLYEWVALDNLASLPVYPPFIKDKIKNIADGVEHFVRDDRGDFS